jgi:hypothetical protein
LNLVRAADGRALSYPSGLVLKCCIILESGQILINKSGNNGLNLAALHVAMHMQLEHEFYFSLSGGDKDTFVRYSHHICLGNSLFLPVPCWVIKANSPPF